jgi:D-glycero-alpha-D-manno-heptose-7-phosphate kinase
MIPVARQHEAYIRAGVTLLLLVLLAAGFWLRIRHVGELGLVVDEGNQALAVRGILQHGVPKVEAWPLKIDTDTLYSLEDNLLLFFTGYSRSASEILKDQHVRSQQNDREMIANLHFIKELGRESKEALETGDLTRVAELMNVHWEHKKKRSPSMSNDQIDRWYELARQNGALGGKLIGAGGGGFLAFYAEDKVRLRRAMREAGLEEVRFRFDFEGTKVVVQS